MERFVNYFMHGDSTSTKNSHFHNDCLFLGLKKKLNFGLCDQNALVQDFSTALGTTIFSFFTKKKTIIMKMRVAAKSGNISSGGGIQLCSCMFPVKVNYHLGLKKMWALF
jgi:hypothetical protein